MVTPPAPEGTHKSAGALLLRILLFVIVIFAGLQCRNPYFTMEDDNLTAGYPFFCEVGHHLARGESPFYSDYIFGGHYNLSRDAQYFCWHPFYLLVSLLADTRFHLWMLDIDALFLYLVAATGFVSLACYLRDEGLFEAKDEWIIFCTLSYTFTMIALVTCASWLTFENNIGALPWLALGILQKKWRWGIGLVTFFSVHQILGGHPEPLVTNSIFLSFFAAGISWWRRSWQPLIFWFGGYALAIIIVSPLLIPVAHGFFASGRSTGTLLSDMQDNRIAAQYFSTAFFLGTWSALIHSPEEGAINGIYIFSLGACAASWCFIPAIFSKAKWSFLERLTLSLTALAVLLVCRPIVISEFLQHVPILKSMRWPFREMVQVQFFFHFFILLRPVTCLPRVRFLTAVSSSAAFTLGMLLYPCTPTFNDMPLDRQIILSGKLEPYWAQVRTFFKPGDKFVILIPRAPTQTDSMYVPFSLIGAYDYPMIARVVCGSAYSQTVPKDQYYVRTVPLLSPWGAYSINARDALLREHPDLKFITVESIEPLKVTLSSRDGPTIDLIPYFPKGIGPW